jgi:hypothetical protein
MCSAVKKLPPDVLKFFREQGAKGGRIGGKRAMETMSPAQRVARAKKASAAAARKRSAKKVSDRMRNGHTNAVDRTVRKRHRH